MKRLPLILAIAVIALLSYAALSSYRSSALNEQPLSTSNNAMVEKLTADLRSSDAEARANAATALSGVDAPEATTALLANLGDEDPHAGYATALALRESVDETVLRTLASALEHEDALVRQRAAIAVSQMELPESMVPALARALTDSTTGVYAAQALIHTGGAAAQAALLEALADDELTTRRHAVMAAIEGAEEMVQQLLLGQALESEDLILVRNATQLRDFIAASQ